MRRYPLVFLIGIVVVSTLLLWFGVHNYITLTYFQCYAHELHMFVYNQYWYSIALYLSIFIVATVCVLPVTALLTIASGFLFGVTAGTCYTIIGAVSGGTLLFLTIRYGIGVWIQQRYIHKLHALDKEIEQYGARYLLFLQLLPVTPTMVINVLAGLTRISLLTYIWTTAVGILPGTLIYTWAGQRLYEVQSMKDILSSSMILLLLFFALLVLLSLVHNKWLK